MSYVNEKKQIFQNHLIMLKNFCVRKKLSDIKHVNLFREWKFFIEAIIYKKKITINQYKYTVQQFFNISNDEVFQIKNINLDFINKVINQETYSESIKFIQNYSYEMKLLEESIINIFPKIFRRLLS